MKIRFNETGRSMVEMLGVLAVVGVLSVGSIMGYRYAMSKYRVNETINEINILVNTYNLYLQQMNAENTIISSEGEILSEENAITRMGYPYEVFGYNDHFEIALYDVPQPECQLLKDFKQIDSYEVLTVDETNEACKELIYFIDTDFSKDINPEDSDLTDDDQNKNKCGLYGSWNGEKCICQAGQRGEKCNYCDRTQGYIYRDSMGRCYSPTECTRESFCNGHGDAWFDQGNSGTCFCQQCDFGYAGRHCEQTLASQCNNHGISWNNFAYSGGCICEEGFYGSYCQYSDKKDECSGNGKAVGWYGYCQCIVGWTGEECEIAVPADKESMCVNGYLREADGDFYCECFGRKYYGEYCEYTCEETENCKNPIYNQSTGTCLCSCAGGYKEDCLRDCSTEIECKNGGKPYLNSKTQSCQCYCGSSTPSEYYYAQDMAYYGSECEQIFNRNEECSEHARRVVCSIDNNGASYCSCSCENGWSGKKCEINNSEYCQNNGSIIWTSSETYQCMCPTGYTGKHCETKCEITCGSHEIMDENCNCKCSGGYYRDESGKCVACNINCNGNGYITTTENECYCDCNWGYGGTNCEKNCNPLDCKEGYRPKYHHDGKCYCFESSW